MSDIGDPITQPIPAVGTSGTSYASQVNAFLEEVKTRLEAQIPLTSLAIDALDMANNELTNVNYIGLTAQVSTPTAPTGSIQRFGGNLWFISDSGACQITNGTAINTASVGGITGDYGGANPAQFRFVDADQTYFAYDDFGGGAWARVWARSFDIAAGATSSFRVRLAFGGAGSYVLTLPAAPPASAALLQMSTTGDVTANNTLANTVTVNELKFTTAKNLILPAAMSNDANGTHTKLLGGTSGAQVGWTLASSTNKISWAIPLSVGDRITGYRLRMNKASGGAVTMAARLYQYNTITATETALGAGSTDSTAAPGAALMTETGLSIDLATNIQYYLVFTPGAAGAGDTLYDAEIIHTRP